MSTTNEHFSQYKKQGGVQLTAWGSFARKVYHSTTQSTKAYWNKPKAVDVVASTANNISTAAGAVGVGAGIAALCGEAALVTAGTAGFVAAVGGPQVAITAGVVGLALFVKSVYSNREHTHEQLTPFMWSLIDDVPPEKNISNIVDLGDAAGHALNLLTDGPAQFKLLGSKLQEAETKFDKFFVDLFKIYEVLEKKSRFKPSEDRIEHIHSIWITLNSAQKKRDADFVLNLYADISPKWVEGQGKIEKAKKQGGEIFEYMRRLVHTGNYLQCAHLVHMYAMNKLKKNTTIEYKNPLDGWEGAEYYRIRLLDKSNKLKKYEELFNKLQKMAQEADDAKKL